MKHFADKIKYVKHLSVSIVKYSKYKFKLDFLKCNYIIVMTGERNE